MSAFVGFEVEEGEKTAGQPSAAAALAGLLVVLDGDRGERGAPLKLSL